MGVKGRRNGKTGERKKGKTRSAKTYTPTVVAPRKVVSRDAAIPRGEDQAIQRTKIQHKKQGR